MTNIEENGKITPETYAKNFEGWPTPALLRAARNTYRKAIRERLADGGFDDVPRDGSYVLGAIVNRGVAPGDAIRMLGVTRQAASQLIDMLAVRGYIERIPDTIDRRRMTLVATERGRAAAATVRAAVEAMDSEVTKRLSQTDWAAFRAGLGVLIEMGIAAREKEPNPGNPPEE